jgi:hypothetical protein
MGRVVRAMLNRESHQVRLFPERRAGRHFSGHLLRKPVFGTAGDRFYHAAVFVEHPLYIPADAVFHDQPDGAAFECCNCGERGFRGGADSDAQFRILAGHFWLAVLADAGGRASSFSLSRSASHGLNVQQPRVVDGKK